MGYNYLTQTAALLDYREDTLWRTESWIHNDYVYECIWFWSNDSALPNSIIKKELK